MNELALYIHIPFCHRRCSYCSFVSTSGRESDIPAYVAALAKEIHLTRRFDSVVKTIYFGGGTPSLIQPAEVAGLLVNIKTCYPLQPGVEITLEANPGTLDVAYLKSIYASGINRLSLGIQSLDEAELKLLGRLHTKDEALQAITAARASGFSNLNLDFIYGLPGRKLADWRSMLSEIINLGAEHLSLYALTTEEDTPLGVKIEKGDMAALDPDAAADEYELAEAALAGAGYRQYEISNWALPGLESRHNLGCWRREDYLGLGCAAHSCLGDERLANTDKLDEYLANLAQGCLPPRSAEVITPELALAETVILGLRLNEGIDLDDTSRRFSIDLQEHFKLEIAELSGMGLLEITNGRLTLTGRGRLLGNEVFLRFLPA
jgi:oxygen-independent coproporphyrinogen III oxidase